MKVSKEDYYGNIENTICAADCTYEEAVYVVDMRYYRANGNQFPEIEYDDVMARELKEWADNPEDDHVPFSSLQLPTVIEPDWLW
jgi:hypothetical protein